MPKELLLQGPAPPPASAGSLFCAVCAGTWKHAAYQPVAAAAEEAAHDREGGIARLPLNAPLAALPPQLAVAWGFFGPFMAPPLGTGFYPGILPLCWTHLLMLDDRGSGIMPASASQMPPAHLHGGVVLDRR
jgi:hypothetical protein